LLVSLASFAAITLCVASQRVFVVVVVVVAAAAASLSTQSGKFWIQPRVCDIGNNRVDIFNFHSFLWKIVNDLFVVLIVSVFLLA
jgi:hypothetical protein